MFDLGVEIGASVYKDYKSARGLILGYLGARLQMDVLRVGLVGHNDQSDVTHTIADYARREIVDRLSLDVKATDTFRALLSSFMTARQVDPENEALFTLMFDRLHNLSYHYLLARELNDYVTRYYGSSFNLSEAEKQNADRGISLLGQVAMSRRKYGTKPAYTEASVGGAWVFYDGDAYRENLMAKTGLQAVAGSPNFAAIVMHTAERDLSGIDLALESLPIGERGQIRRTGEGLTRADVEFILFIQQNGSITTDAEGLQPIEAAPINNLAAIRLIKAEVIANFYDLSMPIDIGMRAGLRNYTQMTTEERENFNPITRLLIPRLRYIQTAHETSSESPRVVRRHDVTWFVRLLPPGWHASPEAVAEAAKLGVALAPNETFVRAHERGVDHKALGYHAVRRSTDKIPGRDY